MIVNLMQIVCCFVVHIHTHAQRSSMSDLLINSGDARIAIKNVVVTADLGCRLNCAIVAQAIHGRCDKDVFPAFVTYNWPHNASTRGFATGRVVMVGCASANDGLLLLHRLAALLHASLGVHCGVFNFRVRNMVGAIRLAFPVNLSLLYYDLARWEDVVTDQPIEFLPDNFPGLSFALNLPRTGGRATVAQFSTGGGVACGLRNAAQIDELHERLCQQMRQYHLGHETLELPPDQVKLASDALGVLPPSKTATRRAKPRIVPLAERVHYTTQTVDGVIRSCIVLDSEPVPASRKRAFAGI